MKKIQEYSLKIGDIELSIINVGAIITSLKYKGQETILAYDDYNDYLDNDIYLGAVVGRTAGRIKDGNIGDGQIITQNFLEKHNLHGNDLHYAFYDVVEKENGFELSLFDPAGVYPGDLNFKVVYTIVDNKVVQEFIGECSEPSPLNFTNHTYFNLGNTDILDLDLKIEANKVVIIDEESLPKEELEVANTAFDFREFTKIKDNMKLSYPQFKDSIFIDNPYILDGDIYLKSNDKKIEMKITSNQEYVVCYTGNYLDTCTKKIKGYATNSRNMAICLETQKMPGDINKETNYYAETEFIFSEIK